MILDEAIKQLENPGTLTTYYHESGYDKAIQLGIEALKAVKDVRANNYFTPIPQLLGETEES